MGLLYRLTIEYDGDPEGVAPPTAIVKLPVLIDATRQVSSAYRLYEKEVAFYRHLAAETPLQTPEIYFADHDPETDDFVLVMQDVGHLRAADQIAGCAREDALAAVAALARHHARVLERHPIRDRRARVAPVRVRFADARRRRAGASPPYWQPFVDFIGDDLSPDIKAVGEWLPGAARDLLSVPDGHADHGCARRLPARQPLLRRGANGHRARLADRDKDRRRL